MRIPKLCLSVCTPRKEVTIASSISDISPTLVIDTSMKRCSRVLHDRKPRIRIFSKQLEIEFWLVASYFDLCWRAEITLSSSISVLHWYLIHQWKGLHEYYCTTAWKPKNLNFCSNKFEIEFRLVLMSWNHLRFVNISPTLVIDTSIERSSQVLQHENPKKWIS